MPTTTGPRLFPDYVVPRVRELPRRLEPVTPDTFGGLVCCAPSPVLAHRTGAVVPATTLVIDGVAPVAWLRVP